MSSISHAPSYPPPPTTNSCSFLALFLPARHRRILLSLLPRRPTTSGIAMVRWCVACTAMRTCRRRRWASTASFGHVYASSLGHRRGDPRSLSSVFERTSKGMRPRTSTAPVSYCVQVLHLLGHRFYGCSAFEERVFVSLFFLSVGKGGSFPFVVSFERDRFRVRPVDGFLLGS